jgi:hypothetical protein
MAMLEAPQTNQLDLEEDNEDFGPKKVKSLEVSQRDHGRVTELALNRLLTFAIF